MRHARTSATAAVLGPGKVSRTHGALVLLVLLLVLVLAVVSVGVLVVVLALVLVLVRLLVHVLPVLLEFVVDHSPCHHLKDLLLTTASASVSVSARWAWLVATNRAASPTPSDSTPPPRCTTMRLRAGAPCRRCCSCRGHRAWPRCWGTPTRPVRRRAEEGTLVALLGFGWAVSASLRSALACWLSFSLAEFLYSSRSFASCSAFFA